MKDGTVKLGDFGIARVIQSSNEKAVTQIGTPLYLSPEICKGEQYNEQTDIWSLGVLFFYMCKLDYPFWGKTTVELTNAIINEKYKEFPDHYD